MAGEWRECQWGDIASLEYGKALRNYQEALGRYRVYGTNGPIGWHNEPLCPHTGVVIGRKGAYRGVHYSPDPFFVIDTAFYLEAKEDLDLHWAYYCLLTFDINGMDSGSAIPSTSREAFYCLPVRVPPKKQQQAIAHILGTLDDKIELNRRMSQTLEAMARAIFQSWFVDFDPVHANQDARRAKAPRQKPPRSVSDTPDVSVTSDVPATVGRLAPHIAAHFPDSFQESELGEIPAGWRVQTLSGLCSTQYGYTASATDQPVGPKFLRVTDINKRNWIEWGEVPHCTIEQEARAAYTLKLGDLVVTRMADPGKSAIIEEEIDAVFASYLVRLKTSSLAHSYYVYGFLKSDLYSEYAEGAKSGSVQANMNAKVIVGASIVVPPVPVMEEFLRVARPLRQHLVANVRESRALVALRDTLLPKLISGELRVHDAERIVGRCV